MPPTNVPLRLELSADGVGNHRQGRGPRYEIVSFLSHRTALEAGDKIATGTPSDIESAMGTFVSRGNIGGDDGDAWHPAHSGGGSLVSGRWCATGSG